jgi:hypothetical protein
MFVKRSGSRLGLLPPELPLESRVREMAGLLVRRHKSEILMVVAHFVLRNQLSGAVVDNLMRPAGFRAVPVHLALVSLIAPAGRQSGLFFVPLKWPAIGSHPEVRGAT